MTRAFSFRRMKETKRDSLPAKQVSDNWQVPERQRGIFRKQRKGLHFPGILSHIHLGIRHGMRFFP